MPPPSDLPRIRDARADDADAIDRMYPLAFPDEDLLPLLADMRRADARVLALVAEDDTGLVGHVAFTLAQRGLALLAPLAVTPHRQRSGIGRALVDAGCARLGSHDVTQVLVLGDPAYYGRLGFTQETGIEPPYPLPAEWATAWQSRSLDAAGVTASGRLELPDFWMTAELWLP